MSLRFKIIALIGVILCAMLMLAAAVQIAAGRFGAIADNLYDNAFVGVHYAHKVEVGFVRFEAGQTDAVRTAWSEDETAALHALLDNMDIAIERAPSARERSLAVKVRGRLQDLLQHPQTPGLRARLADIDKSLDRVVQRFADRALDLRTDADDLLDHLKALLGVVITSTLLLCAAGAALLILQIVPPLRVISRIIAGGADADDVAASRITRRKDEIGAIARALLSSQARVDETLASLEERVRLRTAELEAAKDAAEAANVAKSSFLATMSHEIRTPLNGVLGMAQAIADSDLTSVQRERVEVIRQSGESLLAILNDLLDLSKVEAGKLDLEQVEFDLEAVVKGAHSAFTQLANAKGLSFALVVDGARGTYLGDPTRLRQILYNLISNAVKFTDQGEVRVTVSPTDHGLVVSVADTGPGIPAEALPTIFNKFSQADASTTRRFGGTGLGLAIVQELARLMEGSVRVESREGVGTTFIVDLKLPRLSTAAPAGAPTVEARPTEESEEISGLRVLAAEDNAINRLVLKTLLHQAGIHPLIVEDGAQAVQAWETGRFDLILMDIQMPGMDGPAATRRIRDIEVAEGRPRTPIIALTANVMAHQLAIYREVGMDGHVAKPIEAAHLFRTMLDLIEEQRDPPRTEAAAG